MHCSVTLELLCNDLLRHDAFGCHEDWDAGFKSMFVRLVVALQEIVEHGMLRGCCHCSAAAGRC